MYRKILVPLDGSELAEKVLPHVEAIALGTGAEIVLLRVPIYPYVAPSPSAEMGGWYMPEFSAEMTEDVQKEVAEYLDKVKDQLSTHGLKVSTAVKDGLASRAIIDYARAEGVDLIAMTTHGRTGLSRVVFGSVAEEVLRGADKPMLLVRPHSPGEAKA